MSRNWHTFESRMAPAAVRALRRVDSNRAEEIGSAIKKGYEAFGSVSIPLDVSDEVLIEWAFIRLAREYDEKGHESTANRYWQFAEEMA